MTQAQTKVPQAGGKREALIFFMREPKIARVTKSGAVRLIADADSLQVSNSVLADLAKAGLIIRTENRVGLSSAGRETAARLQTHPHLDIIQSCRSPRDETDATLNLINMSESPLGNLYCRKTSNGERFLAKREFEAGERLRFDFNKAMLMPRVSANWQASVSAGRRSGECNSVQELTDSALAARQRVEKATTALGTDLGGVAIDICCFLKGFEQVEIERKWPKRSAKFMLKAALSVLARHYWPSAENNARPRHWGAFDFRPTISGRG